MLLFTYISHGKNEFFKWTNVYLFLTNYFQTIAKIVKQMFDGDFLSIFGKQYEHARVPFKNLTQRTQSVFISYFLK